MAKKKIPKINLQGLDDIDFNKSEPDIKSAESILEPKPEPKKEVAAKKEPVKEEPRKEAKAKKEKAQAPKGTFPPVNKKRASFNIDEDLHKALKDYSYFNEVEMVEYIFERLVKPDLKKKGYYPPKARK